MRYISLFSGIEAASVAWEPIGFEPIAFSEVDPFCNEVLGFHFPHVPNLGDISQIDWRPYHEKVDIIVGGSPCQAFSVAGNRAGLLDARGALMLEYVRAVREVEPTWCLWENVPGVLSQDRGRAFATLQRELEDCGYSLAWRVLDAQFFGVAQRRRRVFVVGHPDPRCAAAVLFESSSLFGDYQSSKEARTRFASAARTRIAETGSSVAEELPLPSTHSDDKTLPSERKPSFVTYALVGNIIGRKPENGGNGNGYSEELCYTLTAMDHHAICKTSCFGNTRECKPITEMEEPFAVRRLMPIECERLQGFPDNWTRIEWNGKSAEQCPDSRRYKALGNSMAVPVMRWIGRRMELVDRLSKLDAENQKRGGGHAGGLQS